MTIFDFNETKEERPVILIPENFYEATRGEIKLAKKIYDGKEKEQIIIEWSLNNPLTGVVTIPQFMSAKYHAPWKDAIGNPRPASDLYKLFDKLQEGHNKIKSKINSDPKKYADSQEAVRAIEELLPKRARVSVTNKKRKRDNVEYSIVDRVAEWLP